MFDAFDCLGLERRLDLTDEAIQQAFRERGAQAHPDQAGQAGDFESLGRARAELMSPSRRIRHFLELEAGSRVLDSRGTVSADLMDLFGRVAELLQSADALIAKRRATQSALAKALLESEVGLMNEWIEACLAEVDGALETQCEGLAALAFEALAERARNLAFLEKWRAQLRERFAALF